MVLSERRFETKRGITPNHWTANRARVTTWHRQRVFLNGDAAHHKAVKLLTMFGLVVVALRTSGAIAGRCANLCRRSARQQALCPAWFPKVSQAAQHVIYVASDRAHPAIRTDCGLKHLCSLRHIVSPTARNSPASSSTKCSAPCLRRLAVSCVVRRLDTLAWMRRLARRFLQAAGSLPEVQR